VGAIIAGAGILVALFAAVFVVRYRRRVAGEQSREKAEAW
jgi:hypothetical protein